MKQLYLPPVNKISGEITLLGSKSISNRALLLAALAKGESTLYNVLDCDDVSYMLKALEKLGVKSHWDKENTMCKIVGTAGRFKIFDNTEIFLGNAGTAMRFLSAALSVGLEDKRVTLVGDERMNERPIAHLVKALQLAGAAIDYQNKSGVPPVVIEKAHLKSNYLQIDGSLSSQYISALLMVAPLFPQGLVIEISGALVSQPYIDITLAMMRDFGVEIINENYQRFMVKAQSYRSVDNFFIEGDASSASYFLAAAAIGGNIKVKGVGKKSIQGDRLFAEVLSQMGALISYEDNAIICEHRQLRGISLDANHIPDAAMTLATLALFAKGTTQINNIYNWRVKECDRLQAMATELRKVGAEVDVGSDYIRITPPQDGIKHAVITTYNDHRIAMCFSLLAFAPSGVSISNPQCTSKTYPQYFDHFRLLTHH